MKWNPLPIRFMNFSKRSKLFPAGVFISFLFLSCSGSSQENTTIHDTDSLPVEKKTVNYLEHIPSHETAKYQKIKDIPVPNGFQRTSADSNSFAGYLRNLELKTENNTVYLHTGEEKWYQDGHFAVIKMDVGTRDLQQCADAVMRLRAEYLYTTKQYSKIHFNFLSDGKPRYYTEYTGADRSWKAYRKYMDYIFSYANTGSLANELTPVKIEEILPGDVFIMKGNPYGHAVIVVDVAENSETGERVFMIAQSYMPAQEIHILKNLNSLSISPWYSTKFEGDLNTPEWTFVGNCLKRF